MSKKTAKQVVGSGNDYVIQAKSNQKTLCNAIKSQISSNTPLDQHNSCVKIKGRIECRDVSIYKPDIANPIYSKWKGLETIIHLKSYGEREGTFYYKDHYYISSLKDEIASKYAKIIRSHWSIENGLHRTKDVNFNEDNSGIKTPNIIKNLSLIKSVIIGLFKLSNHQSIKHATEYYANRPNKIMSLLNNIHIEKIRSV